MDDWKNVFEKLKKWASGKKGVRWFMILGGLGIALILFSEWAPQETVSAQQRTEDYTLYLEERLAATVKSIEGVGNCQVMLSLESGVQYVYATEDRQDNNFRQDGEKLDTSENSQQSVIVVEDKGLLVTEILPVVQGVVVVCEGGNNVAVQERIKTAVATVLRISEKRVCVLPQTTGG
jgi:stage III sporulation protein AG